MFRWAEVGKQSWESLKICKNGKIHDMKIEWKSINRDKVREEEKLGRVNYNKMYGKAV